MKYKQMQTVVCFLPMFSIITSTQILAQSTPSEFAEMSFLELFDISLDETTEEHIHTPPWNLAYQFKTAVFEGYLDGAESLSFDDVLWNGPNELRTNKNFPVLPTIIKQQAHVIALAYQFNKHWNVNVSIPYINQKTDHISIVNNYNFFTIETDGLGDTSLSATYRWNNSITSSWRFAFGLSLPTGSIDEVGDTPRDLGDQQLPFTMQLGSGTYDFPLELSYQNSHADGFKFSMKANIRTGKNKRHYRLGNNYSLNGRYEAELSPTFRTFAGIAFKYTESIHGQDDDLLLNGAFKYPASITNPHLYGGKKISLRLGLTMQLSEDIQINVELRKPFYQELNGPQPKEKLQSAIYISKQI
jgi:hypothetical protein